jgi:hypothetical protein
MESGLFSERLIKVARRSAAEFRRGAAGYFGHQNHAKKVCCRQLEDVYECRHGQTFSGSHCSGARQDAAK